MVVGMGHHGLVANEFRPGHPVFFWITIVLLVFAIFSGAKAMSTINSCKSVGNGAKHWQVWPPEWVCDGR